MPAPQLIGFDIETGPNEAIDVPPPKYKYGNTKDLGKRQIIEEEQRAKQLDRRALSPYYGRVVSLHIAHHGDPIEGVEDQKVIIDRTMPDVDEVLGISAITDANAPDRDQDELTTIVTAMNYLLAFQEQNDATIVTFHGQNFDWPFLRRRCMLLGAKRPIFAGVAAGARNGINTGHIDVGVALAFTEPGGNWQPTDPMGIGYTLFAYAQRLLRKTSPYIDVPKTQYAEWHAAGELTKLQEAGNWDATRTLELGELFQNHYL